MRRLLDRLLTLRLRENINTATSGKGEEVLRKVLGIVYKQSKLTNFRILCVDAEARGYIEAMEAYGHVALRLQAEIVNEAK